MNFLLCVLCNQKFEPNELTYGWTDRAEKGICPSCAPDMGKGAISKDNKIINNMDQCNKCGFPFRIVPAGVSKKTGQTYEAFKVCSNKACDGRPQGSPQFKSRDDSIREAQQRKDESIAKYNALNAAISMVSHHPIFTKIEDQETLILKVNELREIFLGWHNDPFV